MSETQTYALVYGIVYVSLLVFFGVALWLVAYGVVCALTRGLGAGCLRRSSLPAERREYHPDDLDGPEWRRVQ